MKEHLESAAKEGGAKAIKAAGGAVKAAKVGQELADGNYVDGVADAARASMDKVKEHFKEHEGALRNGTTAINAAYGGIKAAKEIKDGNYANAGLEATRSGLASATDLAPSHSTGLNLAGAALDGVKDGLKNIKKLVILVPRLEQAALQLLKQLSSGQL